MSNAAETGPAAPEQALIQPDQEPETVLTSANDEALAEPDIEPGGSDTTGVNDDAGPDDFVAPSEAPSQAVLVEDVDALVEPTESPPA